MKKSKSKKLILGILLCLCAVVCAILPCIKTISAQAYGPTDSAVTSSCIDNIFDESKGKFLEKNLNLLADKAGFNSFADMISYVEGGGQPKTAADFGHSTVKFGKSFGGDGDGATELVWIPAYLSNSTQGPVLTLWLSTTAELAAFNSEMNSGATTKPSSNNYSTSKIRVETLNNTGVYYNGYGNGAGDVTSTLTAVNYTATTAKTHIFQMYTTGALSSYIVAPADVNWQTGEGSNRLKNDPGWAGNSDGYYFQDREGKEQTWVNDNLWLPSLYEVYDGSILTNNTKTGFGTYTTSGTANADAAGLWGTNTLERGNRDYTWLRSGRLTYYFISFILTGGGGYDGDYVYSKNAVRPALHLNLAKAKQNAVPDHIHSWESAENDGWVVTTPATCATAGEKQRVCTAADCYLEDGKESESIEIDSTAHTFGTAWTSDESNHWHAATCIHSTQKKDNGAHAWNDGAITTEAECEKTGVKTFTCSVCGKTKTEVIPATGHTPETIPAVTATCTTAGSTEGTKCSVCKKVLTVPTEIKQMGHDYSSSWETDGTNHWHICANECGIKGSNAAHTFKWIVDKVATFTETGLRHEECTVCHLKRNENTVIPLVTCLHANTTHYDKVPATCVEKGTVEYKYCSDCQKNLDMSDVELTDLEIPIDPNNHAWGEWEVTKQPNCTQKGEEKHTCADCNHEETRDIAIDPNAHDLEHHEAKAATCTEIGWNEYDECSRCDYTTYDEIPAKGHDWSTEWSKDETNHWHACSRCGEKNDEAAHTFDWIITKDPTEEETGEKEECCAVCEYANGNKETIAKLVSDDKGNIKDLPVLPPNQDYDLEIAVKESESKYNIEGINKGYLVELFVVDGDNKNPYDDTKNVTLMLLVPDGMEEFTLYKMSGDRLTEISADEYTVNGRMLTIRTKLPTEFVFNAPAPEPEQPSASIPWWVWLIVGMSVVVVITLIVVIAIAVKKKSSDGGTPVAADNGELLSRMDSQEQKIDELLTRSDDGGFNTPVELDENGNVIFK